LLPPALLVLALFACGDDDDLEATEEAAQETAEAVGDIAGTWNTNEYRRLSGETLDDIPETLPAEQWVIERPEDCEDPCTYDLTTYPIDRPGEDPLEMKLTPSDDGWEAELEFVSMCIEQTTGNVLEPEASNVSSVYRVELTGEQLKIGFDWDGEPTDAGLAAGCNIELADFETEARRAEED
jgi:hypothetical protein